MYTPSHFAEQDLPTLHAFIRAHSLGTLISQVDGAPFATHLPFTIDASKGDYGTLYCHVARANQHWHAMHEDNQSLVIFRGPHVYVSPAWYTEPGVPTWNYTAVHAYGKVRLIEERDELIALLESLVRINEAANATDYKFNPDAPEVAQRLGYIVGMEIPIEGLHGKFKLSQNRSQRDQQAVVARLNERQTGDDLAIAQLMQKNLKGKP
jgi:transcriptional regulator